MKAPALALIILLLGLMIVLVALHRVSLTQQQNQTQVMERVVTDLTARANAAEQELKALRAQLAQHETDLAAAKASPAEPATSGTSTNSTEVKLTSPQPFQARAYVGKDYLGLAWVVPSNVKEVAGTGEIHYEPVIMINEHARRAFTQTNIVEREVVRNNSYTQVYEQPYWYSYPLWTRPSHPNRPPGNRPPTTTPPPRPSHPTPPIIGPGDRSTPMGP